MNRLILCPRKGAGNVLSFLNTRKDEQVCKTILSDTVDCFFPGHTSYTMVDIDRTYTGVPLCIDWKILAGWCRPDPAKRGTWPKNVECKPLWTSGTFKTNSKPGRSDCTDSVCTHWSRDFSGLCSRHVAYSLQLNREKSCGIRLGRFRDCNTE